MSKAPLVAVERLGKYFPVASPLFGEQKLARAVDGVTLHVAEGETLGLVGESGCGKSTVGRLILRLTDATFGKVLYAGQDITRISERRMRPLRKAMQIVFQDPYSSLNPRMTAEQIVAEALRIHKLCGSRKEEQETVRALLEKVGLRADVMGRYPHEFSGGQRQRIGIARALAVKPRFVVCDEPVSALDVSIQAQILNLLSELQEELSLSYLFISHDLRVIEHVSHRVCVMYLGKIVEVAPTRSLFRTPLHPYTGALLHAIPVADPSKKRLRILVEGDTPSPVNPPSGCSFHPRCPRAIPNVCDKEVPLLNELPRGSGHSVACFSPLETP